MITVYTHFMFGNLLFQVVLVLLEYTLIEILIVRSKVVNNRVVESVNLVFSMMMRFGVREPRGCV